MSKISTLIIAAITVAASQLTTQAAHDPGETKSQPQVIDPVLRPTQYQPQYQTMGRYHQPPMVVQQSTMRRIWIPGTYQPIWIPPKVEVQIDAAGQRHENIIRYGYYQYHWTPGRYELVPVVQQSYVYPGNQRGSRHVATSDGVINRQASNARQSQNRVAVNGRKADNQREMVNNRNTQGSRQSVSTWSPASLY